MELKKYQKIVIGDLCRFLEILNSKQNIKQSYNIFWNEKNIPVGIGGVPPYNDIIDETPHICFKVPTGGGKTFLAANSIKPVFDAMPYTKTKVVVWLVPSDAILEQTIKTLSDPMHPYRQKIDVDFGGRVEVLNKQQALVGQNFNPVSVAEQLTVLVLSYDSFRIKNKESRKVYQENSNLAQFTKSYISPETLIENADETALIQVINQLSPLVIVDESHHALSDLSAEMLNNFNPCFVIDLTATPKKNSNIISYVDAMQLKKENMVKLPVIVYNQQTQQDVICSTIDLRNNIEKAAKEEQKTTGYYIRPIVLFQAQPKGKEDNTTFLKIKERLVNIGIPAEQIAIKTSSINELKNVDLLNEGCKIRYIITVNALKEGWDCPFAYILATLVNRTSSVDVEQILGRILRQPYTRQYKNGFLNMSYVLTSSADFRQTLDKIVAGLNNAGFSKDDYRIADTDESTSVFTPTVPISEQQSVTDTLLEKEAETDELIDFDPEDIKLKLENVENTPSESVEVMLKTAQKQADTYNDALTITDGSEIYSTPAELREMMKTYKICDDFKDEAAEILLPQFFIKTPQSIFGEGSLSYLTVEELSDDFTLKDKDTIIDFNSVDEQIYKVDIEDDKISIPKYNKLDNIDSRAFKEYFSKLSPETKIEHCKALINRDLNKLDFVGNRDLGNYIDRIIKSLAPEQLADLENNVTVYSNKIKDKILSMRTEYCEKQFKILTEQDKIICQPNYRFKEAISPLITSRIAKSLYTSEDGDMNDFEFRAIATIAALPNIKWWHRNVEKKDFVINGFINHYPDFIVMTNSGKIIALETKGDYLANEETFKKLAMGRSWHNMAGVKFNYYMIFEHKDFKLDGAYHLDDFINIIREL